MIFLLRDLLHGSSFYFLGNFGLGAADLYWGTCIGGTTVAKWLRRCATNRKVVGSIPAGVSGFFIDINSFQSLYGPGVDSASNGNEYQEYFVGVKAACA